jgi:uncharacterized membrane protein
MILCFILGGFSIIMYTFLVYDNFLRADFARNETFLRFENITQNRTFEKPLNPINNIASPFSMMLLFNGILLLIGGVSIWSLTREKEIKSAKERMTSLLLMPEERLVIDELKKCKGSMLQSQLVKRTGLSKVKMHRIISKLALKGIIKKYPYGLTNKIVLEKEI